MQEVSGSIPLFSTKKAPHFVRDAVLFLFYGFINGKNRDLSVSGRRGCENAAQQ